MNESDVIGEITKVETIARGAGVKIRRYLNSRYGHGKWRKRKGIALVMDYRDNIRLAEIHWFEVHGIGKRDFKIKRWLEE